MKVHRSFTKSLYWNILSGRKKRNLFSDTSPLLCSQTLKRFPCYSIFAIQAKDQNQQSYFDSYMIRSYVLKGYQVFKCFADKTMPTNLTENNFPSSLKLRVALKKCNFYSFFQIIHLPTESGIRYLKTVSLSLALIIISRLLLHKLNKLI